MLTVNVDASGHNNISLTRGDSGVLDLQIKDLAKKIFKLGLNDKAVLTIKKKTKDKDALVQIKINSEQAFEFKPADTADLECGVYVYDVQVNLADGNVYTVIPPSRFYLEEEVTW